MTYRGTFKNGVVVLDEPAPLADGTTVKVEVEPDEPTLYERLKEVIGTATGLPSDLAENHDHYLHGTPKRPKP
jgi:hypothetical protein